MAQNSGKKSTKEKKEKIFHPQSRKAGQLVRTQLRKSKLAELAKERSKKHGSQVNLYNFFYHALPTEGGPLSLEELHYIIRDVWLPRHDSELEAERSSRRKGRPKSVREQKLEESKRREAEEYRTGIEVVDLTDPPNVELFRRWDQKEAAFIQQLRFVRISSATPGLVVVSRLGKHPSLVQERNCDNNDRDQAMETDDVPILLEPQSRFAPTITPMDGAV
ncbi:Translation machinery-associated protein 16 [Grifola frondosa]|uniref:Translation machinery-associated protein 16 n=1 Tax=Grifola frondosa TaxID=5627 RepID=A0A1C7MAL9_GRIFR|nr:Translation machinery-associated protein 16 [Grifola frondosa]